MPISTHSISVNYLLIVLFCITPFYFQVNSGGLGLDLPYNVTTWFIALTFMAIVIWQTLSTKRLFYSRTFLVALIFPATVIFSGFSSDIPQPIDWLFRLLYIVSGFVFLLALFQLSLRFRQIEHALYALVIATLLQSLVAIAQIHELDFLSNFYPYSEDQIPLGMFQQVNVLASFLATGLMIILFLISRPSFKNRHLLSKLFLVITFGLAVYVLVSTGSRIGVLSLFLAAVVMSVARRKQLARHKQMMALLVTVTLVAAFAGQSGFYRAIDKTQKLTEGEYSSVRKAMYATAVDLINDKPLFGYGIGSFQRVWVMQTAKFAAEHPAAEISQGTVGHPHNEVLLWFIEGGLVAVASLAIIAIVICYALCRCGFSRGMAYAALLLPITLHTQVEFPFYISSVHWFVWLFLVFIVMRHHLSSCNIAISRAASTTIRLAVIITLLIGTVFLVHTSKAQRELTKYVNRKGGDLAITLNNPYFNDYAEKILMERILYSGNQKTDQAQLLTFIDWAEGRISYKPERGMFIILSDAYGFYGDKANQCRVARQGLATYTKNERLQKTVNTACKNN